MARRSMPDRRHSQALKQLDAGQKYKTKTVARVSAGALSGLYSENWRWLEEGVIGDFTLRVHKKDETEVVVPALITR